MPGVVAERVAIRVVAPQAHPRLAQELVPGERAVTRPREALGERTARAIGEHDGVAREDDEPAHPIAVRRPAQRLIDGGIGAQEEVADLRAVLDPIRERDRVTTHRAHVNVGRPLEGGDKSARHQRREGTGVQDGDGHGIVVGCGTCLADHLPPQAKCGMTSLAKRRT